MNISEQNFSLMNRCQTTFCRQLTKHTHCWKCKKRVYRNKYPVRAAYQNLKSNARRRGKPFDISLAEFELFCYHTRLLTGRGRSKDSYTIDRIRNQEGYTLGNIQVLTRSKNSSKGKNPPIEYLDYDWETGFARVVKPARYEETVTVF